MTRRPKPIRSGKDGCEPIATPWRSASATLLRITCGSPAWKPQATLAEVMYGMISSSAPSVQRPQLSPMSALRSMNFAIVGSSLLGAPRSAGPQPRDDLRLRASFFGAPRSAGPNPRDDLRLRASFFGAPRSAGPQPRDDLRLRASFFGAPRSAGPQPRDDLRLRASLSSREHARERVDEAVHVLVGHREGARAESPLGQQNPFVQKPEEHPDRRLPILGPGRTIVRQRLRRPV